MKKAMILGAASVALLLAGCMNPWANNDIPLLPPEVDTIEEVLAVVTDRVDYARDFDVYGKLDTWQLPWETWELRTGDCEDHAFLAAYLLHRIGVEAMIEFGVGTWDGMWVGHAWISADGHHWETISGRRDDELPDTFPQVRLTWTLETALTVAQIR